MKSTYKLFGTVWDGIEDNNQLMVAGCVQRAATAMVSLNNLLCASSENDVAKILEPFRDNDAITIDMDYHYEGENPVIKTFVEKRERQIIRHLSEKFGAVYCCCNKENKSHLH